MRLRLCRPGMRRNLLRFWRLPPGERQLFLQAGFLLTATWLGLRLVGYKRVHQWLGGPDHPPVTPLAPREQARVVALAVKRAAARLPYATCLPRSLTLWAMLRRRQIMADLHVGVQKEADIFKAHAWVEVEGEVLNDRGDVRDRFAAFDRSLFPAPREKRIS